MTKEETELIEILRKIISRPIFSLSDFKEMIEAITEYTIGTIKRDRTKLAQDFIDEFGVDKDGL